MDTVELKRLRALLAAQAMEDASRRPSRLTAILCVLRKAIGSLASRPAPWNVRAPSGAEVPTAGPTIRASSACACAAFTPAPRADALDQPHFEAYAVSGFAPRRAAFGCRDDTPRPEAGAQPRRSDPTAVSEAWAPQSSGFQPHEAETPFFPEDLADGHEDETHVWVPPRRLRLALSPASDAFNAVQREGSVSPGLARDFLLADLASRLAGEQARLETHLRVAQDLEARKRADVLGEPAKAA